ncbi:unnamed protein product [Ambrosiozyma monospora]|uniref:Unnamed protein product n=1 Tax=Ambrosiozyma monospora TaxID=43982 RepID=A0A9W6Z5G0_AMBMO|nr:unnamed protein product [Ambrosiozyma monospora]
MMNTCLSMTSGGSGIGCDNMSVCIVALLNGSKSLDDWYEKIGKKISESAFEALPTPDELSVDLYQADIETKLSSFAKGDEPAGRSAFGPNSTRLDDEEDMDRDYAPPAILQQLLNATNISQNNNIIYLDSSASSLLQSLGVREDGIPLEVDEDEEAVDGKMEEIQHEEDEEEEELPTKPLTLASEAKVEEVKGDETEEKKK